MPGTLGQNQMDKRTAVWTLRPLRTTLEVTSESCSRVMLQRTKWRNRRLVTTVRREQWHILQSNKRVGIMIQILIPPLWSEMYANHRRASETDEWVVSLQKGNSLSVQPFPPSEGKRGTILCLIYQLSLDTWLEQISFCHFIQAQVSFLFYLESQVFFLLILLKIHKYTQRAKVTLSLNHPQNMHFYEKKKSTLHSKDRNTSLKDRDITGTI